MDRGHTLCMCFHSPPCRFRTRSRAKRTTLCSPTPLRSVTVLPSPSPPCDASCRMSSTSTASSIHMTGYRASAPLPLCLLLSVVPPSATVGSTTRALPPASPAVGMAAKPAVRS
eukprot:3799085-Prymnesium_polylepis.3